MAKKSAGYSEEFNADDQKAMNEMREADNSPPADLAEKEVIVELPLSELEIADPKESELTDAKEPNKMVPHAALHEEREARKAADKAVKEATEARIRAEERMNMLLQINQPKAEEKAAMPDPDVDALGALKYTTRELAELRQRTEQQNQQYAEQQRISSIAQQAAYQEQQFVASNPDYPEASAFLLNSRRQELEAFGATPQQVNQQIEIEKFQLAQTALQSGRNPAEMVHTMAKLRGYSPKVAAPVQANLDRIAQGQKANNSLSNVNGTSVSSKGLTGADIAKLSEEDFTKLMSSMTKAQQRAAFGD